ncbi:hypothetical protein [Parapedobacter tibetensis]|uniref:hypothetical protein n=1 Tax=Parapedobacter tibetensis TaxID=2972951 RepID=UPI00214D9208|nr:hypothetical protein [Parapedobacter tibetensis]
MTFSLAFSVGSCDKEIDAGIDPDEPGRKLTISEAMAHYKQNRNPRQKGVKISSVDPSGNFAEKSLELGVVWQGAIEKGLSGSGNAVLAPLRTGSGYWEYDTVNGASISVDYFNYLYMYRDGNQQIREKWISLFPDSAWLYGDRHSYSGLLLVQDLEGNVENSFRFDKEKPASVARQAGFGRPMGSP